MENKKEIKYHYYMKLPEDQIKQVHLAMTNMYGYIQGKLEQHVDPQHGPTDQTGEWADEMECLVRPLKRALDEDLVPIQDLNKYVQSAKSQLVKDIVQSIKDSDPNDELDLLLKLKKAINNYQIIGINKDFNGSSFDSSDEIPF